MDEESLDIVKDNLEKLKSLFPEIFSEDKIDMEKFKASFSDDINFQNERYVLNWAGKADAFKVLQIPTTATLKPQPDQSINFDTTQNVFIEGENLEVLKVMQKAYYGKVKVVCIDPPYNTGTDSFIYPDSFKENKAEYEKRIGDKDEEGYLMKEGLFRKNSKDSGHYHSNWLSMMYPRLFLAKNLLKEDGVIFVHIDDNEVHNLRLLMNEIFGEENFLAQMVWEKIHSTKNDAKYYSDNHEYILCYSKSISNVKVELLERTQTMNERYSNPDNDIRGPWASGDLVANEERKEGYYDVISPSGKIFNVPKGKHWVYSKSNLFEMISQNRIWFGKNGEAFPRLKRFLSEVQQGRKPSTLLTSKEVGHNQEAKREVKEIFDNNNYFDTPKPIRLMKRLINLSIEIKPPDIIFDFFSGSSTIAQAVLELNKEDGGNRKFILVQLPELCDENSEAFKAGYKTISEIGKERIRRVIGNINQRKIHLENEITNFQTKINEFEIELAELKEKKPQLFETEKGSPEIEKIKKQIEQIVIEVAEYQSELEKINNTDLGFKVLKLSSSNFKIWRGNEITEENLSNQLEAFTNPVKPESKTENMLFELMLKAGYLLTDKVEQNFKAKFYSVKDGELIFALEEINQTIIASIIAAQPKKVITLDNLFTGNDQLKTNTVLQMKDAGIDFKTI